MGGGGGSSKTQSSGQTQTHSVADQHGEFHFPQWYEDAAKANYEAGQAIVARPYDAYDASVVPQFSDDTTDTLQWVRDNAGIYQPMYNESGNAIRELMARGDVQRGNLQDYMNPYINNVESRAIDRAQTAGQQAQRAIEQDAQAKGAFGGSRQAIQQAVQGAETTKGIGDLSAKLRADAYDKGVGAQQQDWQRQFSNIAAGKGLAESQREGAKAAQAGLANDYFTMLSAGKMQEDKQRENLEETYKKFLEKRDWDKNQLTWLAGLLGITPTGHTEDIHRVEDSTALTQGMSNTKTQQGMNLGGLIGSAGSLIGALSDRDTKTNIEKLGTDPATKLPVYAYDYKADVENVKVTPVPKRVGFMAQDVERKYPKAVKKVAGKRVIDYTQLPLG
jgi:Chaperone of endosialidase